MAALHHATRLRVIRTPRRMSDQERCYRAFAAALLKTSVLDARDYRQNMAVAAQESIQALNAFRRHPEKDARRARVNFSAGKLLDVWDDTISAHRFLDTRVGKMVVWTLGIPMSVVRKEMYSGGTK